MIDYFPYILFVLFLFIGSLLEVMGYREDQMKYVRWFILGFLLVFVGLRFNTGADWNNYKLAFESISEGIKSTGWESGFIVLMKVIFYLFGNYYVLQFLVTSLLLYSLNKFYTNNTNYPILSMTLFVLIFFTSILMAQLRQSIAMSVILIGAKYVFKRNFLKYLIIVVLACLFHVSAIVALPIYFLNRKISTTISVLLILTVQVFYFFPSVILNMVETIVVIFPSRFQRLFEVYVGTSYADKVEFSSGVYYIATLLFLIVVLFLSKKSTDKSIYFHNTLIILIILYSLSKAFLILERFQSYYYVFAIVCVVNMLDLKISSIKLNATKIISFAIIYSFFLFPLIKDLTNTNVGTRTGRKFNYAYVPYYNVLNYPPEATKRLDWNQ